MCVLLKAVDFTLIFDVAAVIRGSYTSADQSYFISIIFIITRF